MMMMMMVLGMVTKNGMAGQQQTNRKNEWQKFLARCARVASDVKQEKQQQQQITKVVRNVSEEKEKVTVAVVVEFCG